MAEAMLGEPSDVSRVLFVPDYNTAAVAMQGVYQTQGQIWTLVVPKIDMIPDLFTLEEASSLLQQGALRMNWTCYDADRQRVILTAIGAYQLEEVLKASARLRERKVPHTVIYMLEPGRFRTPRSDREKAGMAAPHLLAGLYPPSVPARIFVTHTRPESIMGILQPLHTGAARTAALGYINHGGTLSVPGMLFVNHCTWAHILLDVARLLDMSVAGLLTDQEMAAINGQAFPEGVIF
jgi:phosphoketolase